MASRQWIRWNDDSRAAANRAKHMAENGGSFVQGKGGWMWIPPQPVKQVSTPKPAAKPSTKTEPKKEEKTDS